MKSITWQQVALVSVCIVATVGAGIIGGPAVAATSGVVATVVAWFVKSPLEGDK